MRALSAVNQQPTPRPPSPTSQDVLQQAREGVWRGAQGPQDPYATLEKKTQTTKHATDNLTTGITLTSRKVAALEKVCSELIERAKNKDLRAKGPVRLPTKTLKIMVRCCPFHSTHFKPETDEILPVTDPQDPLR